MRLYPVDVRTLNPEVFSVFGANNALLTAGDQAGCNTMTIGWCQLGRLWNVPACTVFVRPERYTYQFTESHDYFTVSVLPLTHKATTMKLCGTKSGREIDKIKECGLTLRYGAGNAPFFDEAEWVLVCKKAYVQDLQPDCVLDREHILPYYGEQGGWHRMYVGEVVEAYIKK